MNNIKSLPIAIALIAVCSCATVGMRSGYTDWDSNRNGQLNRYEFVTGYQESNYFFRWNRAKNISAQQFYETMFHEMDQNKDSLLTCQEFSSKISYYYFQSASDECATWDDNHDKAVTKEEFNVHAMQSKLLSVWDISDDKKISEREMATGMFFLCDLDNDGTITPVEFNIWKMNRH